MKDCGGDGMTPLGSWVGLNTGELGGIEYCGELVGLNTGELGGIEYCGELGELKDW